MSEMEIPSNEKLAEVVYEYCQNNNINKIREDVLFKKIADNEMKSRHLTQEECENKKYEELSEEDINNACNLLIFSYKLSKRFYDIIDILIDDCKADREKRDGEKYYYLTFYLNPLEVELIKNSKSIVEILANDLYSFCKTNNIEVLEKDDVKNVIDIKDETVDKVIDVLEKKNLLRIYYTENKCVLNFHLTDSEIQLNKNIKLMVKNAAELLLDYCNQNEIKYIEKGELKKIMNYEDDFKWFDHMLNYLKKRHLIDIDYNSEDGKYYITIYE